MSSIAGDPLLPCDSDPEGEGTHEWFPLEQKGTGDPMPSARICFNCNAVDYGPEGRRISHRDSLVPLFPAATRSYRTIITHNPDV